ncbi:MAG TPA: class I adenylate-forming enzyme family protein [Acidimicrobiales bacterium]|nr:class I adenylate-forming enzyme family protein [Acidimicrobiales bacterium]
MSMTVGEATERLTAPGQMFEIDQVEVRGISTKIWKNTPPTLADIVKLSRGHGEKTFIVYEGDRLSFEEHFRAVAHVARQLRDRFGVREGDRVAIAMRNFPEWSIAFWAAACAGAVVVPLNAWWTAEELQYGLDDSGAKVVFVDREREVRLRDAWASVPGVEAVIVARASDGEGGGVDSGHVDMADLLTDVSDDVELPEISVDTDDDATIFYTSGTTGRPKGALGTHRNICTNVISLFFTAARGAMRAAPPAEGAPKLPEVQNAYLLTVPLFHATGCHSILVANLLAGGKLVMVRKFDAGQALELIQQEKVTIFGGVPAMAMQILDHPDFDTYDTSSVRSVAYGGAPAPPDLVRRIKQHFPGGGASNGYGMTETSSLSTMNQGDDYVRKPDSVGLPVPVVDVKVVDPLGNDLAPGEVGELWIKGPNIVKGYWNKPEATAETFTDGWVHTGDVARIDDEGFVYIVDRAKDMLIRGGENIYCVEIEAVLHDHPAVSDAAVIGIPDDVLGEEVGAVVQLRPGTTATEDELRDHVRKHLAGFKVPKKVWFSDEPLPRNPAGKILKRQLRDELVG